MSGDKLIATRVITDFRQRLVCVLPVDFYFDDTLGKNLAPYEQKGDTLSMAALKALFPDEVTVQSPSDETGETFRHRDE